VLQELESPIACHRVIRARGRSARRHVVANGAVDAVHLARLGLPLEVREVRHARELRADPRGLKVDGAPIGPHGKRLTVRLGIHVLAEVPLCTRAFDDERFRSEDAVAPAKRRCRVVHDPLFRCGLRAGGERHGSQQRQECLARHEQLLVRVEISSCRRHSPTASTSAGILQEVDPNDHWRASVTSPLSDRSVMLALGSPNVP
jgi:hypothetical protein